MGGDDPVGDDIADIPRVLRKIKEDWNEPETSLNRMTAFTLSTRLRERMRSHYDNTHDGSLDVLIAGCEVSLWLGEQFASDLHTAFPKLSVECISANKLLGLLGQRFPIPQFGFRFNSRTYNLHDTIVLLVSHSGGTFATLNCSYLLKAFTPNLFVVTSEWDTQVARSVRAGRPGRPESFKLASYVFTTFCGSRPAEPCSLTVAATQQLLTQILLHLMYCVVHYEQGRPELGGSKFDKEEVQELEALDQDSLLTIDSLVKGSGDGDDACVRGDLIRQGRRWAQHILEGPISWIVSAMYIAVTVIIGATPLSATVDLIFDLMSADSDTTPALETLKARCANVDDAAACADAALIYAASVSGQPTQPDYVPYVVGTFDAIIFALLPWWTTVLLRLVQRRRWLHRVSGRSLLIGDIPWVAQALEAYVSKLFALSYSIASLSVAAANPGDHLVHRHTHRVVRGSLLAVGRPDGRLNALAAAENTVCLSVNQASSIQNFGVTCESITVGHNPSPMPLTDNNLYLPRQRPLFFSEHIVERNRKQRRPSMSASALLGALTGLQTSDVDEDDNGINDVLDEVIEARSKTSTSPEPGDSVEPGVYRKIEPLRGDFVGSWMAFDARYRGHDNQMLMDRQHMIQSLYETRIASLHRFVSFLVMFHAMAKRVRDFWPRVSFGLLGYDMSRTHSIMRIATTASPVSGMEVREKTLELAEKTQLSWAKRIVQVITAKWYCFDRNNEMDGEEEQEKVAAMLKILYGSGGVRYVGKGRRGSLSRGISPACSRPSGGGCANSTGASPMPPRASPALVRSGDKGNITNGGPRTSPAFVRASPKELAALAMNGGGTNGSLQLAGYTPWTASAGEIKEISEDESAGELTLDHGVPDSSRGTAYEAQYASLARLSGSQPTGEVMEDGKQ